MGVVTVQAGQLVESNSVTLTELTVGTVRGSAAAGGALYLSSTSHATKGKIYFGANSVYDEVNDRWGAGTLTPSYKWDVRGDIQIGQSSNQKIRFHSLSNWIYNLASDGDNFKIYDNDNTDFVKLFYAGGTTNKYASILGALYVRNTGNVFVGTTDIDGNPSIGRLVVKGSTNDGSTNIFVGRDSDEANVIYVDTNGNLVSSAMITAATKFKCGAVEGKGGSITFDDAAANTHLVTLTGGIVTSWKIENVEQLT